MPRWPLMSPSRYVSVADVGLTAHASANTKSTWTQLIAALPFDIAVLLPTLLPTNGPRDYLMDIGVGSAGNEQVVIANLLCSAAGIYVNAQFIFPVALKSGDRLAARVQATVGSSNLNFLCNGVGGAAGFRGQNRVETWGAVTADSGGTSVDPGGAANTYGSWVQLVAASSFDVSQIMIAFGNQANSARTSGSYKIDIGIGSAGNEQVIIPKIYLAAHSVSDQLGVGAVGPFPVAIPAGSRVAVRDQSDITDATDRLIDVVVYGMG